MNHYLHIFNVILEGGSLLWLIRPANVVVPPKLHTAWHTDHCEFAVFNEMAAKEYENTNASTRKMSALTELIWPANAGPIARAIQPTHSQLPSFQMFKIKNAGGADFSQHSRPVPCLSPSPPPSRSGGVCVCVRARACASVCVCVCV
jgi:hypothetical protein